MTASAVLARTYKFFDTVDINEFRLIAWDAETFAADTQEETGQSWYHRAHELGEAEAERRLKSLATKWGEKLR